jgi:hypothetical protein
MEQWWNDPDRGKPQHSEKYPVSMPRFAQKVPHEVTWD